MDCVFGTDTGEKWGACSCTAIECRCAERIEQLQARVIRDKVDYHTRLARSDDPYALGYVLVRSRYCTPEKCSYHTPKDK